MAKFRLEFDTDKIFREGTVSIVDAYFRKEPRATAKNCAKELGWSKETWERHMAGIFSQAVVEGSSPRANIVEIDSEAERARAERLQKWADGLTDSFECTKCGSATDPGNYTFKDRQIFFTLRNLGLCATCAMGDE
ncbi:unnamed protein product [marine sediment metagenome]|uniref:Uncharacterized protein n=1 Tax=marine sediment metagenome TaxID=412755 RepID=X1D2L9_9ZZZZ